MLNMGYLHYTFAHRQAFKFVVEKLLKNTIYYDEMMKREKYHDLDKALLYTLIDKKSASKYHRNTSNHHMENDNPKDIMDYVEAVIDYECAGYTKEDKPLNAYDTVLKYQPNHSDKLMEIMHQLGIDKSYANTPTDAEWVAYAKEIPTDEKIMYEIYNYIYEYPNTSKLVFEYAKSVL